MPRTTHGHAGGGSSRTYRVWAAMLRRCRGDNPYYGGRGIKVCERWHDFANFPADVGEILPGLSLDRVDVNGGYEPGNVRLATSREQVVNKRNIRLLTIGGVTKPLFVWAEEHGLNCQTLNNRVRKGWPEESLLTPARRGSIPPTHGDIPPTHGNTRHGHSRIAGNRTYRIWAGMRTRCRQDPDYAGRGIKVCGRWQDYQNFLADVGEIPVGLSLDRINNDGDYEPGNVRLATTKEQARNRRSSRPVTISGVTKTLAGWCEETGLSQGALDRRIAEGWPEDRWLVPAWETFQHAYLTVGGRTQTLAEWARESGLKLQTLWRRVQKGWPPEKCVAPARKWVNRRSNSRQPLTVDGRTQTITEWSSETGLSVSTISSRISRGYPPALCVAPRRNWQILLHSASQPPLTVDGRTQTLAEWSRETGLNLYTIYSRVRSGFPPEKCVAPKGSWKVINHPSTGRQLTVGGRTQSLAAWSRETGLDYRTIHRRVKRGFPPERCIAPKGSWEVIQHHPSALQLTVGGRTQSPAEWSRETGVKLDTIYSRVRKGYAPERCIEPIQR